MSHRICAVALSAAVLAASLLLASPAEAEDERPCATFTEFWDGIQVGMTRSKVSAILDGPGVKSRRHPKVDQYQRLYAVCGKPFKKAHLAVVYSSRTNTMHTAVWVQNVHVDATYTRLAG